MAKFIVLSGAPGAIAPRYIRKLPAIDGRDKQTVMIDDICISVVNTTVDTKLPFQGNLFNQWQFVGGEVLIWAEMNGRPVDVPFRRPEFDELDSQFDGLLRQCRRIYKSRN